MQEDVEMRGAATAWQYRQLKAVQAVAEAPKHSMLMLLLVAHEGLCPALPCPAQAAASTNKSICTCAYAPCRVPLPTGTEAADAVCLR